MITTFNYYEYSLDEIKAIKDEKRREEILNLLKKDLASYQRTNIFYNTFSTYEPIINIITKIERFYEENTSTYFAPGDICFFYPITKEIKAAKDRFSDISKVLIAKGSYYFRYTFRIFNKTKNASYILYKPLNIALDEIDFLPMNILEFDHFCYSLNHAYELGLDDFYSFGANLGQDDLDVRKIRLRRK